MSLFASAQVMKSAYTMNSDAEVVRRVKLGHRVKKTKLLSKRDMGEYWEYRFQLFAARPST